MAEQISIWRWAITDDLDVLFARLICADEDGFNVIAGEMSGGGQETPNSAQDTQAETEAKIRAMDLPPDVLETTLAGFREMMAEAQAEEAALEAAFDAEDGAANAGGLGVALASSHMFFEDPYASLEHEEIDRQTNVAVDEYRVAISTAVGNGGQSFAKFLGLDQAALNDEGTFEMQVEAGFEGALWIWIQGDTVFYLSHWQDEKELPIDLGFHRVSVDALNTFKARL